MNEKLIKGHFNDFLFSFSDTHRYFGIDVERKIDWRDEITIQIDFALATFFCVYFFLRFLAADDKLMFIFTIESIVDFMTVPPVFLTGKKENIFHVK